MPAAHRNGDLRTCGATTSVTGQSTVTVNGKLWAVLGDKDSHCTEGALAPTGTTVKIEGSPVTVVTSPAAPDNTCNVPTHNDTDASSGSGDVNAYT